MISPARVPPASAAETVGPDLHPVPASEPAISRRKRQRCQHCGRFVQADRTLCQRCETDKPGDEPAAARSPAPILLPDPIAPPIAMRHSGVFDRARSDFVVPRPSELHPPIGSERFRERGRLLPRIRPETTTHAGRSRVEPGPVAGRLDIRLGPREVVGLIVIAAGAITGAAVAVLAGPH